MDLEFDDDVCLFIHLFLLATYSAKSVRWLRQICETVALTKEYLGEKWNSSETIVMYPRLDWSQN